MNLPVPPKDHLAPHEWAERVPRHEPHGLDVLEARVIAYATEADEISHTSGWRIAWNVTPLFLGVFASIGGFAVLLGNPEHIRRGWVDSPDMNAAPWAALSYGVAIIGVIVVGVQWLERGRRRDRGARVLLGWMILFGLLGIPVAFQLAAEEGGELGLTMVPAYVMIGLAVALFVIIQCSPVPEPEQEKPEVPIEALSDKAMKYVMDSRNRAIDTFVRRRLLPGLDPDKLKARPLGRLHIEDE